ncbi:translesion error-prone DNA polymerase V autoproteolytic subunit [Pseudoalteromonas sp. SR44-5]|jgi:DNA polymerase V|uniref:Translesion error-prone DNA polymerase V autoproteolytic subunit n=2 Tax=Pseudoalteromonas TaxID=53246 RepID=A0ABY3FCL6_9GAMM|nr:MULTISPECIES: translesion error-prone DNA polymerase V autoproteolytic subunit [Pseudoalteromonas]MBB1292136.1 translesion error-prone DNA polymerase V autoproteolytic subunit [Pseudoalteromonas sp. SR41-4]MBB1300950.1 translesion error-prone DNA polymerase V autoproteolytic subunit [Pseudoalteromonas sp. SR44-8]MBB1311072.1 translesion error-prone DNA polymerase V autoproteolytic subunit [Pseudoalteromonas sp. SR41-8]MBB1332067.1 translesion error-prone DNA polymerase V autoproteolytic subu|tara:strand:+ start:5113 stop:5526 length:414 start_codon:yes stop_codon:yes gene_type:complete
MFVIPIYIEAGVCGFESPAAQYKELGLSLDQLLIKHPDATFIGVASGCSMQEVGIFDGDLLLVDRAEEAKNGDVIVANLNGLFVCKLLDKTNARLLSASDLYPPVQLTDSDEFQLEGVVTRSIRLHRSSAELRQCIA